MEKSVEIETDTDTDTDADTDTDTDVDPNAAISAMNWSLHADYGSLVYVSWYQEDAGDITIEYSFDGEWVAAPIHAGTTGTNQVLIVGIPYGTSAEWRLSTGGETFDGDAIITGDLDAGFPTPSLVTADSANWLQTGNYYLGSLTESDGNNWAGRDFWTFIIDRQARVVWAHPTPNHNWTLFAQVSVSGDHILWDEQTYWSQFDDGANSSVHRTYLDTEIEEITTPGLHHPFCELPDGTLAWLSAYHGNSFAEALVEKAPGDSDSDTEIIWACDDWPEGKQCSSNGLLYMENSESYLMSFYTNESIVEIDRSTGENLWWIGDVQGGYSFNSADDQFFWQYGISVTDADTIILSSHGDNGKETRAIEYNVNHSNQSIASVWSFNSGIFSKYNGHPYRLLNGNTLYTLGSAGRIVEVDQYGSVNWEINFGGSRLMGRGEFIEELYSLLSTQDSK